MKKPIKWATNEDYDVGHGIYTGTETKTEPSGAVAADGFVPDEAVGMQHLNYVQNANASGADAVWNSSRNGFDTVHATYGLLANAVSDGLGHYYLCGGSSTTVSKLLLMSHSDETAIDVTPTGVTRAFGVTHNPTSNRLVCVGFHASSFAAYSDDQGVTWTTATDYTGENFRHVVWDATNSLFIATGSTTHIATSADGTDASWTARTPGTATEADALVTYGGRTVRAWGDGTSQAKVDLSTNGTSWTTYSLPAVGSIAQVCGLGIDPRGTGKFVAVIKDTSGGTMEFYSSALTDGSVWIKENEILTSAGPSILGNTVLNLARTDATGNIIVGVQHTDSPYHGVLVTPDLGGTWEFFPIRYLSVPSGSDEAYVAVAGDRVFFGSDDSSATAVAFSSKLFGR